MDHSQSKQLLLIADANPENVKVMDLDGIYSPEAPYPEPLNPEP